MGLNRLHIVSNRVRALTVTMVTTIINSNKIQGGQIIRTVKYADDFVLLAKEEKVLQEKIDKLIEIGRCYGVELNVERNKSNENFKTTISSKNYRRPKTNGECGIF